MRTSFTPFKYIKQPLDQGLNLRSLQNSQIGLSNTTRAIFRGLYYNLRPKKLQYHAILLVTIIIIIIIIPKVKPQQNEVMPMGQYFSTKSQ